ncbi:MAG TPA: hypothetical protein VGE63_00415 [Candidatus Paceibacterota bacterium]
MYILDTTQIIAQVFGLIITIFGLSIIVNQTSVIASLQKTIESKAVLWVLGFITLIIGAVMVVFHNLWTTGLELFITILGWLTLIKGIIILTFPNIAARWYRKVMTHNVIIIHAFIVTIIGAGLLYFGFCA